MRWERRSLGPTHAEPMRNSCGVRVTSHEAIDDTEASYMAWIVPIPPSARHPQERYQVCFQDGKRHRSAGIFPTKRLALAEKRAIERGDRQPFPEPVDLDPQKARMPFGEYVSTKWWPAWKDQHPSSEYGTRKKVEKRILPTFGDIPIGDLDASTVGAWKAAMIAEGLVSCAGDSLTICSERIEDLVGGLGPHKRPWVLVPVLDPRPDVSLQGLHALVDAALQRLGGQLAEPPLDQVEPRRAGRDEVQLEAGMGGQPPLDGVGFVGGVVVADQMDIQLGGHLLVELDQELAELHRAVPAVDRADHLAAGHVQGREQAGDPVAGVVVGAPLGHARHHRQHRLGPVQRLDLGLF